MSDSRQRLKKLVDEMKGEGIRPDLLSLLKRAKARGIVIDMDEVRWFVEQQGRRGAFFCPEFIPAFITSYLKESAPRSILDPWAGSGGLLGALVRIFEPSVAIGLSRVAEEQEIARLLHDDTPIDWRLGDPLLLLDDIDDRFDVVVGCLPWGLKRHSLTLMLDGSPVELRDQLNNLVMLKASMLLDPGGLGFFVVGPGFMGSAGARTVRANLARFGLFTNASLELPRGTFSPETQMGGSLVVVGRKKPQHLFVGELRSDPSANDVLLENLKARKEGRIPQLGALVDPQTFRSLEALVALRELEGLGRRLGLPSTPLREIATQANLARRREEEAFLDLPNAVYLPLIGRSPAVGSLADLQIKPHNYAQLVLDPEKATAVYVANFFNSSLGQKIRGSLSAGFIPKISKSRLLTASVYLSDLRTQMEMVRIDSVITDSLTQLEMLRRQLWSQPKRAKKIERAIKSLNAASDFESWMESVPFPLASILLAFHREDDVERKWRQLFYFFEALSQFTATVLLSAFAADKHFYGQYAGHWIDKDPKYRDWVLTPSFGGWNTLGARLAKTTRTLLSGEQGQRERFLALFGFPDPEFLDMLTSKKLFAILREVNEYRDRWVGHGGIVSAEESGNRLKLLTANLSNVRQVISDHWTTALLLQPKSSTFSKGVYNYRVRSLMGTTPPFRKLARETLTPMDRRKLYLLHNTQLKPVELLPLIRLMESPKTQQNACYFYNRCDKEGIRWVSYHFEGEAELLRPDDEVESVLSLMRPADNAPEASMTSC